MSKNNSSVFGNNKTAVMRFASYDGKIKMVQLSTTLTITQLPRSKSGGA